MLQQLVRLMRKFDLGEVSLQDGDKRIRLRRGASAVASAPMLQSVAPPAASAAMVSIPTAAPTAPPPSKFVEIKSPMVGTFYAKPAPDKDDYVKVGSRVTAETVVCKIEAMKIFNDLAAGHSGVIAEICIQNGQFVEYDQVLFRVEPS
ncbi:MAG: acetyl-CoA carboxylase biotin carboxyl carrier protein [Planctomycetes bacterium]|nr:acetyl-CoA carboxylase biotin carboxyl carrier protein [Planctomycetota bacterium]